MKLILEEPIDLISAKDGAVLSRITELTLRAPRLGDLVAAMDGGRAPGTMVLTLASRCSGVPAADLAKLSLADGARLLEAVQGFLPAGLLNGSGGSASSPPNSVSPPTGDAGGQPNSTSGLRVRLSSGADVTGATDAAAAAGAPGATGEGLPG